jgi:hypothetical protein
VVQDARANVQVEVFAAAEGANAVYSDALESLRARKFDTLPKAPTPVRSASEKEAAAID